MAPKPRKNSPSKKKPQPTASINLEAVPGPTDVEAFKGGGEGFSGRAVFRLIHFTRALRLRDSSSTFRSRFAKSEIMAVLEQEIREGVVRSNVIRTHLYARSYQIGCTIKVKYFGSPRWDILTGFTKNYPLTKPVNTTDFLAAYGHALSQTLASPEEIRIISFGMLVWFRGTAPQVHTLKALNKKPIPMLYDDDGYANPRLREIQREKRKANTIIIKTRFGF